jgi:3-methyladenine DNA glycosylase AlkD
MPAKTTTKAPGKNAEPSARKHAPKRALARASPRPLQEAAQEALSALERMSTRKDRDNLARFGITAAKAFGVSMANIQAVAKRLGRHHELAAALWDTGWYEARMLASFVAEPARVTPAQMDRWCRDFDNWGLCDTLCFNLFDRTPHAWAKVAQWSESRDEFVKRAAFALLWGLTVHDKHAGDEPFLQGLLLIERAADDERHLVKKAVNMALRAVGKRNRALHAAAVAAARRLAASPEAAARWVGKDALRELTSAAVLRRLG